MPTVAEHYRRTAGIAGHIRLRSRTGAPRTLLRVGAEAAEAEALRSRDAVVEFT